MTLYFYTTDNGCLLCKTAEARETKSCYMSVDGGFPNHLSRMPKGYIGVINDGYAALMERNDAAARSLFKNRFEDDLRRACEAVKAAETKLANLELPVEG